jgi:hypothetical protein
MKSGNLNFLEPSGPLSACNGTALPLFCYYFNIFLPAIDVTYLPFATTTVSQLKIFCDFSGEKFRGFEVL